MCSFLERFLNNLARNKCLYLHVFFSDFTKDPRPEPEPTTDMGEEEEEEEDDNEYEEGEEETDIDLVSLALRGLINRALSDIFRAYANPNSWLVRPSCLGSYTHLMPDGMGAACDLPCHVSCAA